jgi:aspartyl-tRNA(Asn)/glutamyl-tRNA(Gln) amidotransferase subunit A
VPLSFPLHRWLVPAYYILATAEASSNLSRYDGVRFGLRSSQARTVEEVYALSRTEGFGFEVKKRILLGSFVLSSGYADQYYAKAMQFRESLRRYWQQVFTQCDAVLAPVTSDVAYNLGRSQEEATSVYMEDVFTVNANLAELPAVSVPLGMRNGLPFGMQWMSPHGTDVALLQWCGQYSASEAEPSGLASVQSEE